MIQQKPIFILQHEPSSGIGAIQNWIQSQNLKSHYTLMVENPELPDFNQIEAAIILGGVMNVDDESQYPWLKKEKLWIKQALDKGLPLFGICLGAQLIAEVMGAQVGRLPFWEIGWIQVFNEEQKEQGTFFSWHGYGFEVPKSAEAHLFGNHWQAQGFRVGNKTIATQFHPETDMSFLQDCSASLERKKLTPLVTGQNPGDLLQGHHHIPKAQNWLFTQLNTWL